MSWNKHDSCLYKLPITHQNKGEQHNIKIAGFDMDSTLILSNCGYKYAKGRSDWIFAYPNIVEKIQQLYKDGYIIVIFSNRKGPPWSYLPAQNRVDDIEKIIQVPLYCFFATKTDNYRKPNTNMMLLFCYLLQIKSFNENSFYCGDASGYTSKIRWFQWTDVDSKFSKNCGLTYKEPQEIFDEFNSPNISENTKLIITIGQMGSGWEVNKPMIGQIVSLNEKRDLIILDDSIVPSLNKNKECIYYVLGMHPTQDERLKIIQKFGINETQVEYHLYCRPPYDNLLSDLHYCNLFEYPSNGKVVRIN